MLTRSSALSSMTVVMSLLAVASLALAARRHFAPASVRASMPDSVVADWRSFTLGGTRLGPDSARVTITLFSDIRCGFCRKTWLLLENAARSHPGEIAIVYRHFPFKGLSLDPARAGVCAEHQRKFKALYDHYIATYESSPPDPGTLENSLGADNWAELARDVGMPDGDEFWRCTHEQSVPPELHADLNVASRLGVAVVPTLLVGDTRVVGNPGEVKLDQLIARAKSLAPTAQP